MEVNEITTGDFFVNNFEISKHYGIHNGDIHIKEKGTFILHDIVNGNVYVSQNSIYLLRGIQNGDIYNHGEVTIYGILENTFKVEGDFDYTPDSKINVK